jgi:cytochrome c oxidase subunit 1
MSNANTTGRERVNYRNAGYGPRSWLLTTDHKRIAILYLIGVTVFFAIGGLAAALVRLELLTPAGDVFQAETYNKIFTTHGVMMVFFFMIPAIPAVLGNFLVPLMIGAKDLAFPRINLLSWYLYVIGGLLALWAVVHGGVDTGWTFYTPYSTVYSNGWVVVTAVGIFISGFSSILTGLNFLVTIHTMRAPMGWMRMPLFCWGMYATSIIQILGTPVIAITVLLVGAAALPPRHLRPGAGRRPGALPASGSTAPGRLHQILPAMAVISEARDGLLCRKPIFGYKFIAGSSVAIAVLSFLVWGHHMFCLGAVGLRGPDLLGALVHGRDPSAIKVFNWTATLYKGRCRTRRRCSTRSRFIGLFTFGGLTGLMLATLGLDIHVHDTYFIMAHFHYINGGRHDHGLPRRPALLVAEDLRKDVPGVLVARVGVGHLHRLQPDSSQFIAGYLGMPRGTHVPGGVPGPQRQSTAGASILGIGYLIPLIYFAWSMRYGQDAADNPWGATGLEWQTPSPPPTENFPETPVVTGKPYDYLTAHEEVAVG